MSNLAPVTVVYGDGIGPEIMADSAKTHTEKDPVPAKVCAFGGKPGHTLAQGQ